MNQTQLKPVSSHCHLGITLTENMSWSEHIQRVTSKASKRVGILYRSKDKLPRFARCQFYTTFIRPILEYGSILFNNCTVIQSHSLELIQRRAALYCTGANRRTETRYLLRELGWDTLEFRRHQSLLLNFFKLHKRIAPLYMNELLPPIVNDLRLRNYGNYRPARARLKCSSDSFIYSAAKKWNALDSKVKRSQTLCTFKKNIKTKINPLCKLYSHFSGDIAQCHCRMRLGLSDLRKHLFCYNLIDSPTCINCNTNKSEDPVHFLLQCPAFAVPRQIMLQSLSVNLPAASSMNKKQLTTYLLEGNPDHLCTVNRDMFKIVMNYIQQTGRFSYE